MKDRQIQSSHERAAGDRFIETYNKEMCCHFTFKERPCPPKPDLIYYDEQDKKTVGIEITDGYSNKNDAKATWDIARGKERRVENLSYSNSELVQGIIDVIAKHCNNSYDFEDPIILLVVTRPAMTKNKKDFEGNVLSYIKLPNRIQFSDIYLDLSFLSYHHYYHLYPK